jgi:hypothetical protein
MRHRPPEWPQERFELSGLVDWHYPQRDRGKRCQNARPGGGIAKPDLRPASVSLTRLQTNYPPRRLGRATPPKSPRQGSHATPQQKLFTHPACSNAPWTRQAPNFATVARDPTAPSATPKRGDAEAHRKASLRVCRVSNGVFLKPSRVYTH